VLISLAKSGAIGTVVPPSPPSAKVGVSSTNKLALCAALVQPSRWRRFTPSKRMKCFTPPRCAEAGATLRRLAAAWFLASPRGAFAPLYGIRRGTASIQFLQRMFLQRLVPWWYHGFHSFARNRVLPRETVASHAKAWYREFHSVRRSVLEGVNPW